MPSDAAETAVWFLSLLCELGYIDNSDDVESYVEGTVAKPFFKLAMGTEVYIVVDDRDQLLYHVYHRPAQDGVEEEDEEDKEEEDGEVEEEASEDDYEIWWENPDVEQFSFKIGDLMKCLEAV
jgi:hypothetical protein